MSIVKKNKIIVILGPTASGKTKLGVALAAKNNGEIVSADSRQVYKGMDVGTGKDLGDFRLTTRLPDGQVADCRLENKINKSQIENRKSQIIDIPYHLIDVVEPMEEYSVARYQQEAYRAIDDILSRGKLPIVVGGSGLYLQTIVDGYELNENNGADPELRQELEKLNKEELLDELEKLNKKFVDNMNNSDRNNKRRLIRYIEICKNTDDKELKNRKSKIENRKFDCDFLLIGLKKPQAELEQRIYQRLVDRLEKEDMIGEVRRLHDSGVTWERLISFGLEYKFITQYLQEKMDYDEMVEKLNIATRQFAKKQLTWFRRWEKQGREIHWVDGLEDVEKVLSGISKVSSNK